MTTFNTTPTKMAKNDRVFVLDLIDGTLPKSSTGITDSRLFQGGNKLHIHKDPESNFWSFSYDEGIVPEKLRCAFTNATLAIRHAEIYYKDRNLTLKEVDG